MSRPEERCDVIILRAADTRIFLGGKLTPVLPSTGPKEVFSTFPPSTTEIRWTGDGPIVNRRKGSSTVKER